MKLAALIFILVLIATLLYFQPKSFRNDGVILKSTSSLDSLISIDRINPKTEIYKQSIVVIPPSLPMKDEPIRVYRDSFSVALNRELESQWQNEMYQQLLYLDEEHADKISADYHAFMKSGQKSMENDLTSGIKQLSDLNGQSGEVESIYTEEVKSDQNRAEKIKHILGPHYEFLEGARRDFLSNSNT